MIIILSFRPNTKYDSLHLFGLHLRNTNLYSINLYYSLGLDTIHCAFELIVKGTIAILS